jgi:tetratricopeptide (TPR) repeat protein
MTSRPNVHPKRFVPIGLLLATVVLGLGLRLYQLGADSLWLDEITTVITSRSEIPILDYQGARDSHPPLLYLITRCFLILLGDSDFVVRLPAALLGCLALVVTYKLGGLLWTSWEGVMAALLLAISPYHVRYSQEARHYSLMVFLAIMSLVLLLQALKRNRKSMWILYGLCTSLNLYTHYFAFLILPSELLFAAWVVVGNRRHLTRQSRHRALDAGHSDPHQTQPAERKDIPTPVDSMTKASPPLPSPQKQGLYLLGALVLVGVSYLPWLPFLWKTLHGSRIAFEGVGLEEVPGAELSLGLVGEALQTYTGLGGIPLLLLLALFALGLASCKPRYILLLVTWIAAPFLFPFVVRSTHFFDLRYAICVVPILLLLTARGICVVIRWLTRQPPLRALDERRRLALVSAVIVCTVGTVNSTPLIGYYLSQKEDWRSATDYLLEHMGTTDIIVADGEGYGPGVDAGRTLKCLIYYFSLADQNPTILTAQGGLGKQMVEGTDASGTAWGVFWHEADLAMVEQGEPRFQVVEFPEVAVIRPLASTGELLADTRSLLETLVALQPLPEGRVDLHLALAELCLMYGSQANARYQVDLAAADAANSHLDKAVVYFNVGEAYLKTGSIEQAVWAYEQALTIQPDHPQAQWRLKLLTHASEEEIPSALFRRLGFQVALLGYDLDSTTVSPGESVRVTLWWLALAGMDKDYTAFIHLTDEDGRLWAQHDRLLERNGTHTSSWHAAQLATEEHLLELSPDTPSGEYTIQAGLYWWETGERLPVWDVNGRRLDGDAIPLGLVTVVN